MLELQNKNSSKIILQTKDTQTSLASKSTSQITSENVASTINNVTTDNMLSVMESLHNDSVELKSNNNNNNSSSTSTIGLDLTNFNEDFSSNTSNIYNGGSAVLSEKSLNLSNDETKIKRLPNVDIDLVS